MYSHEIFVRAIQSTEKTIGTIGFLRSFCIINMHLFFKLGNFDIMDFLPHELILFFIIFKNIKLG